jgi:hypothetical protein
MNRIVHKDKRGFWIFTKYYFYIEDKDEGLTEVFVDKQTWEEFDVGDYQDPVYKWFYSYRNKNAAI